MLIFHDFIIFILSIILFICTFAPINKKNVMQNLRIKELCKQREITFVELAERTGLSQPFISNMVTMRNSPRVETLEKVASALGVELWELFTPSTDKGDFMAMVKREGRFFCATSYEEFKVIARTLEQIESNEVE